MDSICILMALIKIMMTKRYFQRWAKSHKSTLTNKPKVIPKMYKLKNSNNKGKPNFKIDTPNNGDVKITAGIKPIKVLIKAVKINDTIISLSLNCYK